MGNTRFSALVVLLFLIFLVLVSPLFSAEFYSTCRLHGPAVRSFLVFHLQYFDACIAYKGNGVATVYDHVASSSAAAVVPKKCARDHEWNGATGDGYAGIYFICSFCSPIFAAVRFCAFVDEGSRGRRYNVHYNILMCPRRFSS